MKFTVLIPTFNNGAVIRNAIESVLAQTVSDLELFVVADGAPEDTHAVLDEYAARDARMRPYKFAKGPRHGEDHRNAVLRVARGEMICYLGDDDVWFPDHLEVMQDLLAEADFAHTRHTEVYTTYEISGQHLSIADPAIRQRMVEEKFNIFGPTVVGHRLDAYKRLPQRWSAAAPDLWTDLTMWRKWIAAENVRFRSSLAVTTLHFPRSQRQDMTRENALNEVRFWAELARDARFRAALRDVLPPEARAIPLADVMARARELREAG
jgi:GalNAc5-diNAcBac-PP-undecaprenol beta-1,3-glucosyltransferase